MKWIIIGALRLSIYLGAVATIAAGGLAGYLGGLSVEDFPVTGIAGAVIGAVIGVFFAGLIFGTLTVLLDIRDSLADLRDRGGRDSSDPDSPQSPQDSDSRKEPFLGKL